MIITRRKIAAPVIFVLLLAAAAVSFVISLTFGSVAYDAIDVWDVVAAHIGIIPGDDVFGSTIDSVVWSLRAPRGLLALIVGAGLALAGVVMQTLVRNPLADPYLLGCHPVHPWVQPRSSPLAFLPRLACTQFRLVRSSAH